MGIFGVTNSCSMKPKLMDMFTSVDKSAIDRHELFIATELNCLGVRRILKLWIVGCIKHDRIDRLLLVG